MKELNKKHILILVATVLISGLIGFYSGRYYEISLNKKRFAQMGQMKGRMPNRFEGGPKGEFDRPTPPSDEQDKTQTPEAPKAETEQQTTEAQTKTTE